jgi:hypothetical protein
MDALNAVLRSCPGPDVRWFYSRVSSFLSGPGSIRGRIIPIHTVRNRRFVPACSRLRSSRRTDRLPVDNYRAVVARSRDPNRPPKHRGWHVVACRRQAATRVSGRPWPVSIWVSHSWVISQLKPVNMNYLFFARGVLNQEVKLVSLFLNPIRPSPVIGPFLWSSGGYCRDIQVHNVPCPKTSLLRGAIVIPLIPVMRCSHSLAHCFVGQPQS